MPKNLFYTNGTSLKGIDLPQYPDSAWEFITEKPETNETELYSRVAAVYRTANLTAEAISSLPFALVKGETDFDVSDDWQNLVGFMHNPRELLRLWRLSLFFTNSAYGFMEGNNAIKNLRYILPTSVSPIVDGDMGLIGFDRKVGTEKKNYPLMLPVKNEQGEIVKWQIVKDPKIFYMFRLDHTTELLPAEATEFRALMAAAGVLFYADYYIQNFFQRGGIKPTMLMVKGVASNADREKIEGIWDKVVHGWSKYLGKIFNADQITPIPIGEGIENLRDSDLHEDNIADIALAAGIPLSLLLANSANYSTAKVEYMTWFRDSVIPWADYMADCLNDRLFTKMGLHFEFRPEITNKGQEEERERATAYLNYINAGMKPSIAAQVVGIDLPTDMGFDTLDADYAEMRPKQEESKPTESVRPVRDEELDDLDAKSAPTVLTIEQVRELELWQGMAFRKLKKDKSLDFPFVCKTIPETVASAIRERLPGCKSEQEIIDAFELTPREDDSIKLLADALNRAAEALEVE